jgi:hypothetical protein
MYLVPLENSAQCRATQQVLYELFTFITPYVVHFLPVLDFRAALNPYTGISKRSTSIEIKSSKTRR